MANSHLRFVFVAVGWVGRLFAGFSHLTHVTRAYARRVAIPGHSAKRFFLRVPCAALDGLAEEQRPRRLPTDCAPRTS